MTSEIKRLSDDSVRRIVAEQAITDISSIVKELVDNALDAESTTIKIRLFGQGMDIVEVSDDGSGIPPESRPRIAERYATSKISSFEDIYSGTGLTMGFRGEALFSMACLSQRLIVATRTEEESMAERLEFGKNGILDESSVQSIHRKVGTTVAVVEPFSALPARRIDMMRRIRGERTKLFKLMESYAIFNVGVQLNLIDITTSGREDIALATSASSTTISQTISSVLGHKFLVTLCDIRISLEDLLKQRENDIHDWEISGLMTKNPQDDPEKRVVNYYCINGRVVDLPKITSLLKKISSGFGGKKKPSCILNFTLPNDAFDINLSPDKQQVLLTHEEEICHLVEGFVTKLWASQTQGVFELQELEAPLESELDDDDDGETQKHKRRYAFVHDLATAKLQHHSEERQRNDTDTETKRFDTEESPNNVPETERPSKRIKSQPTVGNEEEEEEDAPIDSSSEQMTDKPDKRNGPLSIDSISDMERRKWNAVRSRFNSIDGPGELRVVTVDGPGEISTTPVTPDSPSRPHTSSSLSSSSHRISRISSDTENNSNHQRNKRPIEPLPIRKQTLMEQFAFSSSREIPTTTQKVGTTKVANKDKIKVTASRHSQDESGQGVIEEENDDVGTASLREVTETRPKRHTRGRETGQVVTEDDHDGGTASISGVTETRPKRRIRTRETEDSVDVEATEEDGQLGSASNDGISRSGADEESMNFETNRSTTGDTNSVDKDHPSPPSITWDAFKTTEDVCRESRLERIQMMKRKLDLQRASPDPDQSNPTDNNDVGQSVGISGSKGKKVSLSKEQFRDGMEIIGQFNMGFVLARCFNNHLWILDQHACDEKFNFEKLCRETVIHEQKLVHPMPLDLSPAEESCILDHMEIFETNGFRFHFNATAKIRHRLSLTALPHSGARDGRRAVQFNKDDVSTLCSILMDGASYDAGHGGTGTDGTGRFGNNAVRRYASTAQTTTTKGDSSDKIIARLPKAIAMFASRACRSSIMIGTALSQKEMERIVRRLADVEQPWNCPHGRPTMRHVGEVLSTFKRDERKATEYISGPTITMAQMSQEMVEVDEVAGRTKS